MSRNNCGRKGSPLFIQPTKKLRILRKTGVKIPDSLIKRLRGLGPHFCLVESKGKSPAVGGKGWQKPENLMNHDDPQLQKHLKQGGNYGVVAGGGLVILDLDHEVLKEKARKALPQTFTVLSPGSQGEHQYFKGDVDKPIRLRDRDGENIGDIQASGKMVVGPNSIHPTNSLYRIIRDIPLAYVTRTQLVEAFKDYVVPDREINRVETQARREKNGLKIDLDILQVVPLGGLQRRGDEYFGSHPVHGSQTGQNFWVNPAKNCWHCFRHQSGGGPLLWVAVEEGIIRCEEALPGALSGKTFKKVLDAGRKRGLNIPELNAPSFSRIPVEELERRKYGDKVIYHN